MKIVVSGLLGLAIANNPLRLKMGVVRLIPKKFALAAGLRPHMSVRRQGSLFAVSRCVITHAIAPDGTNGGVGFYSSIPDDMQKTWKTHVKKTEQSYKPWYAREKSAGEAAVSMAIAGAIRLGIL